MDFKQYPNLTEAWTTADGQVFPNENLARVHSRTLDDRSVTHHTAPIEEAVESPIPQGGESAEANAPTPQEEKPAEANAPTPRTSTPNKTR